MAKDDPVTDDEDSDGSLPPLGGSSSDEEVDCPVNTSDDDEEDEDQEFDLLMARLVAMRDGQSVSDERSELRQPNDDLDDTTPGGEFRQNDTVNHIGDAKDFNEKNEGCRVG